MDACIIMHNMILVDERGQDNNCLHYELMYRPVRVHRREERVTKFIASYEAIRKEEIHLDLQNYLIEEWWTWNGQQ
jgi:hypothetical protein